MISFRLYVKRRLVVVVVPSNATTSVIVVVIFVPPNDKTIIKDGSLQSNSIRSISFVLFAGWREEPEQRKQQVASPSRIAYTQAQSTQECACVCVGLCVCGFVIRKPVRV